MRTRTKACPTCGKNFSYVVGRGNDRVYCFDKNCWLVRHSDQAKHRLAAHEKCKNPECDRPFSRISSGLCEKCYYRLRRRGTVKERNCKYRYKTGAGYIEILKPDHPLSNNHGRVFEHRLIMFEKLGGDDQCCEWCGKRLSWTEIIIDHLNEIKDDNRIENLVVSCNNCNRARGAFIPFVKRMTDLGFHKFIEVTTEYHHNEKSGRESQQSQRGNS